MNKKARLLIILSMTLLSFENAFARTNPLNTVARSEKSITKCAAILITRILVDADVKVKQTLVRGNEKTGEYKVEGIYVSNKQEIGNPDARFKGSISVNSEVLPDGTYSCSIFSDATLDSHLEPTGHTDPICITGILGQKLVCAHYDFFGWTFN